MTEKHPPEVVSVALTCSECHKPIEVTKGTLAEDGKVCVYVDMMKEHRTCAEAIARRMGKA